MQSPNFEILLTTLKKMRPPSSSSAADRFPQTELWPQLFVVFALQFCYLVICWFHFLECFYPRKKWATLLLCYRPCWPNWTTASTFSPLPTAHSWCKAEANSRWHPARPPTTSLVAPPLPPTRGGGVGCHWWRSRLKVSSTLALTFQDKLGKLVSTLI